MTNVDPNEHQGHGGHDDHGHGGHDDHGHGHGHSGAGEIIPENSPQDWMLSMLLPVLAVVGMMVFASYMYTGWTLYSGGRTEVEGVHGAAGESKAEEPAKAAPSSQETVPAATSTEAH